VEEFKVPARFSLAPFPDRPISFYAVRGRRREYEKHASMVA
jgi:hypothetical protein